MTTFEDVPDELIEHAVKHGVGPKQIAAALEKGQTLEQIEAALCKLDEGDVRFMNSTKGAEWRDRRYKRGLKLGRASVIFGAHQASVVGALYLRQQNQQASAERAERPAIADSDQDMTAGDAQPSEV